MVIFNIKAQYTMIRNSPLNVFSHRPAFHILMVLSAEPVRRMPCSGSMATAHTAAEWPAHPVK